MTLPAHVRADLQQHEAANLEDLKHFLRIPTVSADPACTGAMAQGADYVAGQLRDLGCEVDVVQTAGHPIVWGRWLKAPGAPTVMVYGHYDVQPPDPLDLWTTPPFEPTERDGALYARGATDDKGQVLTHIKSAQAWVRATGGLPVNIHFVIEGEEEVGSKNLDEFLARHREQLRCDVAVISDSSQLAPGIPAITVGLRGIVACEFTVTGPKRDLHSGVFGGAVANPANGLARLIASLHDAEGRVQIPGFYDAVRPLTATERDQFATLPFEEEAMRDELGLDVLHGEASFTTLERRWARPTCDVNGLFGGYQGTGPKTIIPAQATAKLTCRLVPDQNPDAILAALEQYLQSQLLPGLRLKFTSYHGCQAFLFDAGGAYLDAAREAIAEAFGTPPVLVREGGSIPVVTTFRDLLGVDTLLLGWGQNTDNLHSPDEHFSIADFHRGTVASAALWPRLAAIPAAGSTSRV